MLTGETLSQWLQGRVGTVVNGAVAQVSATGLLRVSDGADSHLVRVGLPVVHGGQAAVARVGIDGAGQALALRVQAVSSQTERSRQMERLVNMVTVGQAARTDPAAYPAALQVLESFVITVPGHQMAVSSPDPEYELWCDLMRWCPSTLADHQRRMAPASQAPDVVVAQMVPLVATVHAVHRTLGIVHRDITPTNVLVDEAGRLLLADWGVAHTVAADHTSTYTQAVGNRGFSLPPETLAGDHGVGRYTDAWYLGSLLVWMLTDQTPGPHQGPPWLPPGLPGGRAGARLDEVVHGLCHPDPHQRMDLGEAVARLHQLTGANPADWVGPAPARRRVHVPGHRADKSDQRAQARPGRRKAVAVAAVLVVLAAGAAVLWNTRSQPAEPSATCWTDVDGDCPAFDADAIAHSVFIAQSGDGTLPQCSPSTPRDIPGVFVICGWEEQNIEVEISFFPDMDTLMDTYTNELNAFLAEQSGDAPRFVDGPDGPVFIMDGDELTHVAYCFAELPMCLHASGDPSYPVSRTTQMFRAISPEEAHRVVEYLAGLK
ncbi:MAG: protein kinase [Micrococcales bacterium]|nr:protein kinase [Micrococcales bacterium]